MINKRDYEWARTESIEAIIQEPNLSLEEKAVRLENFQDQLKKAWEEVKQELDELGGLEDRIAWVWEGILGTRNEIRRQISNISR